MRKFDELRVPHSCLNRAEADEPLFVLLGRDIAAQAAIAEWIRVRIATAKNREGDPQLKEAEMLRQDMMRYERERRKRIAQEYADEQARRSRNV